jgi:[ribosomal protein S5]-alanine N-acetyltransferase
LSGSLDTEAFIHTDNLVLEPINRAHAVKLFESLQAHDLYTYIPHHPPETLQKLEDRYTRWSVRKSDDLKEIWLNYALYHRMEDVYVGTVQATMLDNGIVYIAYEVFPKFWKRGIAREACSVLIDFIFKNVEHAIITAHIDTQNERSIRLIQSLGFKFDKVIPNADFFKDRWSDENVYILSREVK